MASGDDITRVEELARKAAEGNRDGFSLLVEATHEIVYRLALRITGSPADAQDVVQETYIRVWKNISSLRDFRAAPAWIFRVARNVAYDSLRKNSRRRAVSLDAPVAEGLSSLHELLQSSDKGPESSALTRELAQTALEAVAKLKEKHRTVLLLREVDGMSYEEIAMAVGCSIGTVESRIFRARKALSKKLAKHPELGNLL